MRDIITYDERLSKVCMNEACNNKCTKMHVLKMGSQNMIHFFCDEHAKLFIDEILGGDDDWTSKDV